jgi:hypothetical protein
LGDKTKTFLSQTQDKSALMNEILSEVDKISSKFSNIERIIFVRDAQKSWRSEFTSEFVYKGKREKDHLPFDMEGFNICMHEFLNILRSKGIYTFNVNGCEGDDALFFLSDFFFQKNQSSIIVSGDSDIKQLIKSKDDFGTFVSVYDPFARGNKFFVDKKHLAGSEVKDFGGIFELQNDVSIVIRESIVVEPLKLVLIKILSGDKGDNIPSCYYYQKGTQTVRFTDLRAEELINAKEEIKPNYELIKSLFFDEDLRKTYAKYIIAHIGKDSPTDELVDTISKGIKRNISLIFLSDFSIPGEIMNNLRNIIYPLIGDKEFYLGNKKLMNKNLTSLLVGTKYEFNSHGRQVKFLDFEV